MKRIFLALGIVVLLLVAGCTGTDTAPESGEEIPSEPEDTTEGADKDQSEGDQEVSKISSWMETNLNDVNTGKEFSVGQFDRPVLVESFAVWCPTCTTQQKEIKKLHEEVGDSIVSVSLNIDSNEDQEKVQSHIDKHGFDWYYAIAPGEMTKSLKEEFGNSILVAPRAPVILVCEDNSFRRLADGVKTAQTLKEEVEKGC